MSSPERKCAFRTRTCNAHPGYALRGAEQGTREARKGVAFVRERLNPPESRRFNKCKQRQFRCEALLEEGYEEAETTSNFGKAYREPAPSEG